MLSSAETPSQWLLVRYQKLLGGAADGAAAVAAARKERRAGSLDCLQSRTHCDARAGQSSVVGKKNALTSGQRRKVGEG